MNHPVRRARSATRLLLAFALTTLILPFGVATPAHAVEEMTKAEAAALFSGAACAYNKSLRRYGRVVYGPDDLVTRKEYEGRRRAPIVKAALRARNAEFRYAKRLLNIHREWPAAIEKHIMQISNDAVIQSVIRDRQSDGPKWRRWLRLENRWVRVGSPKNSRFVRAYLGLPIATLDNPCPKP